MRTMNVWGSFLFLLATLSFAMPTQAHAQSRKELKKMCREQFKQCKKSNSRKYCRKQKKQCRKDNKVTFKDDLKLFQEKLFNFAQKVAGTVELSLDTDENKGEYIEVKVHTKLQVDMGDIAYYPNNYDSHVSFQDNGEYKDFVLRVYTSDLENHGVGEELQTSEGRSFPKFIDGVRYESLYGEEIKTKKSFIQLYFDGEKQMFGLFIPSPFIGTSLSKVNEIKNKIPVIGQLLPNINSIPVNVKIQKEKVGRVSLLSADSEGNNSGVVLLFDHAAIKDVLREQ